MTRGPGWYDTGRPVDTRWQGVINDGPMCLTRHDWDRLEPELSSVGKVILKRLLVHVEDQSHWIVDWRKAHETEMARIAAIGDTLRRAGLRSYTDENGRIYVAAESRCEER